MLETLMKLIDSLVEAGRVKQFAVIRDGEKTGEVYYGVTNVTDDEVGEWLDFDGLSFPLSTDPSVSVQVSITEKGERFKKDSRKRAPDNRFCIFHNADIVTDIAQVM